MTDLGKRIEPITPTPFATPSINLILFILMSLLEQHYDDISVLH